MLQLLASFSVDQILVYSILLALAIKGGIDFFLWAKELYKKKFDKDHKALSKQELLEQHYVNCKEQHVETLNKYVSLENKIDDLTETVNNKIDNIENQLCQLTCSDMHAIKGWIVEKHHALMKQGWVDDFTMDTLEKRYSDYVSENGNSYIGGLMAEIRELPHYPTDEEN